MKIVQIIGEKMAKDGSLLYRVQWQDTLLQNSCRSWRSMATLENTLDPKLYDSKVAMLYWHVHRQDTWEPEEAMHNQPLVNTNQNIQSCSKNT